MNEFDIKVVQKINNKELFMTIIFWFVIRILLIILAAYFLVMFFQDKRLKEAFQVLISQIKENLRGSGLISKSEFPVELYILLLNEDTQDEEEICDECLDALDWEPMDIADWMQEGFPKNPTPYSKCQGQCRCALTPWKKGTVPKQGQP